MSQPTLRQTAGNAIGSGQARTVTVNLTNPTVPGNLVVVYAVTTAGNATLTGPAGFTLIRERSQGALKIAVWYLEGAPALTSLTVSTNQDRSVQVRVLEYAGAAQSGSLDKVTILTSADQYPRTGSSGTTAQSDSIVVAAVANQYASTTQFGFAGALTRLIESVSPQTWGFFRSDPDDCRSRLTIHQAITSNAANFFLEALLSAIRNWIAILCVFKGGSSGPARMTSRVVANTNACNTAGTGSLTVFGPLQSIQLTGTGATPMCSVTGVQARMGPFAYQYRLGGWDGLLIGNDTPYQVESHDGLEGWQIRTSDDELPRGDGALRGVDLQSSRQILFELKVGGTTEFVEDRMDTLYRALVPQRDEDWELIWRHPGRPLRMMRCRPVDLVRGLSWQEVIVNHQKFALLASDPRHYSAFIRQAKITNTAANAVEPIPKAVLNEGNGFAYPNIRITGPASGPAVTRVELVNATYDVSFVVEAQLPSGSALVGDMEARATGAARSVVTIDSQSKYGAWQHPRETFRLGPGANDIHLVTVPAGAPVTCTLDYRDTWSG